MTLMRKMTRRNGLRVAGEGGGGRARYIKGDVKGPCTNLQCRLKRGRSLGNHMFVLSLVFFNHYLMCYVYKS